MKPIRLPQTVRASATRTLLCAVLFFAVFSYLIPKTCDDWIFTARLLDADAHGGLFGAVVHEWKTLNGRLLGNGLSIALAGSKLLRTLFKTAVFTGLLCALSRLSGMQKRAGFGVACAFLCMLLVPAELRKQTYAWDSGFINYAVPTLLLFCYLLLITPFLSGARVKDTALKTLLCLLLGVASALFVENIAACALALGLGLLVWQMLASRRIPLASAAFFLGAILGTALMLASPTYRTTLLGGDAYRAVPTTLSALLLRVKSNYQALSAYSFGSFFVLHLAVSGSSLALLLAPVPARPSLRRLRTGLIVLLCALPVYFALSTRLFDFLTMESAAFMTLASMLGFYPAMLLDALLYGLYVAAVVAVLLFFVPDVRGKRLGLICIFAALAASVPMLFVWPIDFRCFLPAYLFWALIALLLVDAALAARNGRLATASGTLALCAYAGMAAVCLCNLVLYASCPRIERVRTDYLAQQMRIEAPVIVLPEFDCEPYLHYPTVSLGDVYYYQTPGDIEAPFLPYAEWKETFSFGLSEEEIAAYEASHGGASAADPPAG